MATPRIRSRRSMCPSLLVYALVLPLSILGLLHLLEGSPVPFVSRRITAITSSNPSNNNNHKQQAHAGTTTMAAAFLDAVKSRRTWYELDKKLPIKPDMIKWIVRDSIQAVPSAFNSQSNRAVVLCGAEHDRLWDIVGETLKAHVTSEKWEEETAEGVDSFKAAAGTIMFFVDEAVVQSFAAEIPSYASQFATWATQSDAMLQHTIWTALEAEGLGANLQHYNPIIDDKVAKAWSLPPTWRLTSQLVFGGRVGSDPAAKEKAAIEDKVMFLGA